MVVLLDWAALSSEHLHDITLAVMDIFFFLKLVLKKKMLLLLPGMSKRLRIWDEAKTGKSMFFFNFFVVILWCLWMTSLVFSDLHKPTDGMAMPLYRLPILTHLGVVNCSDWIGGPSKYFNDEISFSGKIILIPSKSNKMFNSIIKWPGCRLPPNGRILCLKLDTIQVSPTRTSVFFFYTSAHLVVMPGWLGLLINIKKKKTIINPTVGKLQKKKKENENRKRGRSANMCDSGVGNDHCDGLMCEKRRTLGLLRESTGLN